MPSPHVIRLRGPWEFQVQGDSLHQGRITYPLGATRIGATRIRTEAATFSRAVRAAGKADRPLWLVRHFNRPTGLTVDDRVWLFVQGRIPVSTVEFNGRQSELTTTPGLLRQEPFPAAESEATTIADPSPVGTLEITHWMRSRNEVRLAFRGIGTEGTALEVGDGPAELRLLLQLDVWLEISTPSRV